MGNALVVGRGEIGSALTEVLSSVHDVQSYDVSDEQWPDLRFMGPTVMHICFPYGDRFEGKVRDYHSRHDTIEEIVIHSTVPVGTSRDCGALHSPVIGLHPNLAQSLRTFTKFIGGEKTDFAARHLRDAGIKVLLVDKQETTELLKLMSTLRYAVDVEYTKEVKRLCDELDLPFEAWMLWTENYNHGYAMLDHPEFNRPNLTPMMSAIGGHCLLPNCELIGNDFVSLVQRRNE